VGVLRVTACGTKEHIKYVVLSCMAVVVVCCMNRSVPSTQNFHEETWHVLIKNSSIYHGELDTFQWLSSSVSAHRYMPLSIAVPASLSNRCTPSYGVWLVTLRGGMGMRLLSRVYPFHVRKANGSA